MQKYGDKVYLQGIDYFPKLPSNFRNHAIISETYLRLNHTFFDTYSEYVGEGIMELFSLSRRPNNPIYSFDLWEHMLQYLSTLQDEKSYIKQHYLYMWIGDLYYKLRNEPNMLEKAIAMYEQDIELLPFFARQPRPMAYPSLKRLISVYEKQGDLNRALYLAEMGVKYRIPLAYEYEEKVEKLKKKI